jgi:hypothetical protein
MLMKESVDEARRMASTPGAADNVVTSAESKGAP